MNESNIRKYARLMEELGLTGLEVTEENQVVRLERMAAQANPLPSVTVAPLPDPVFKADPFAGILSPMVGVFYSAPVENAEPFVRVGTQVKKGDTLCVIEAMKLMNEITAEQDGTITEVCAKNGQVVEYGAVLFRIGR